MFPINGFPIKALGNDRQNLHKQVYVLVLDGSLLEFQMNCLCKITCFSAASLVKEHPVVDDEKGRQNLMVEHVFDILEDVFWKEVGFTTEVDLVDFAFGGVYGSRIYQSRSGDHEWGTLLQRDPCTGSEFVRLPGGSFFT